MRKKCSTCQRTKDLKAAFPPISTECTRCVGRQTLLEKKLEKIRAAAAKIKAIADAVAKAKK